MSPLARQNCAIVRLRYKSNFCKTGNFRSGLFSVVSRLNLPLECYSLAFHLPGMYAWRVGQGSLITSQNFSWELLSVH